jgi:hypothetical protein
MAITQNTFTGDGSTVLFSFTFPYLDESHIKVSLNGSDTILYTLANATTIQMNTAPANGVAIRIYRETELVDLNSTFFAGSAIRSQDLNDNFLQSLYLTQETRAITVEAFDGNIPDGSIGSSKLADTAVNTAQLASSAVTTDKVADSAITQAKIGTNVLTPTVSEINGGPLAGFRNAIINGNFDIWQRGTSFTGNEFGADRWGHSRLGTTHTATQQAFTLGQTDVPGEPTYYCRTVVSSVGGSSNFSVLLQAIEDVRSFAGQQVTISFWAKADATKNIAVDLAQFFGTGGSPSAEVTAIGTTKVSIGTTFQKVTVTATIPSISGKTLGTNNNHYLTLKIWFDAGSDFNARTDSLGQQSGTFEIAQVQVEPGPVATPFERRPIGTELALCQRYFWSSSTAQGYPIGSGQAFGVSTAGFVVALPVPMRSIFVTAGANNLYGTSAGGGNVLFSTVVAVLMADTSKAYISLGGASGLTAGDGSLLLIGTAGVNGSLSLDAEL